MKLHFKTVSLNLKNIIEIIGENDYFKDFNLCGRTALSLQIGYRISIDANFVSENEFDKDELIKIL